MADSIVGDRCAPGGAQLHPKSDVGFEWHLLKLRHCEETRGGNPVGVPASQQSNVALRARLLTGLPRFARNDDVALRARFLTRLPRRSQ